MRELRKVLYVEDDDDIRMLAQLALESVGGMHVLACSTGMDAIAKGPAFEPDLILLDAMMAGMDGPETLTGLRALPALAHVPAMFMTAKVQPAEVAALRATGAIDVIAKPFDPMTLASVIRSSWQAYYA